MADEYAWGTAGPNDEVAALRARVAELEAERTMSVEDAPINQHDLDCLVAERDAALAALRALCDAMPRCDVNGCERLATKRGCLLDGLGCDEHWPIIDTVVVAAPWADALTAALAVLEKKP